jgi:hypothetical protein
MCVAAGFDVPHCRPGGVKSVPFGGINTVASLSECGNGTGSGAMAVQDRDQWDEEFDPTRDGFRDDEDDDSCGAGEFEVNGGADDPEPTFADARPGRHHRSAAAFRAAKARSRTPDAIPDVGKGRIAIAPWVLRGPTFGAGDRAWHASQPKSAPGIVIPSGRSRDGTYIGTPMHGDHAEVLYGLLDRGRGHPITTPVRVRPRSFAVRDLGWADSAHSVRRLSRVVRELMSASIFRCWNEFQDEPPQPGRFILGGYMDGRDACVTLSPEIGEMFRGHLTWVSLAKFRSLRTNLGKWLFTFIAASDCAEWFELERLRQLYGTTQKASEFGRDAREALRDLTTRGYIVEHQNRRGAVFVVKSSARATPKGHV